MANASDFRQHAALVQEIPIIGYMVPVPTGRSDLFYVGTGDLDIYVARDVLIVARSFEEWREASNETPNTQPLFEWGSVASFRPDDPIILVVRGIQVQAMMQLKEGYAVPCLSGPREPLVYVSFLEVAPRNQLQSSKRYLKGLGQLLLRLACERS
jgi:hypothetical protein